MPSNDIRREQLLPLANLPDYLKSRGLGKRVSYATVWRWVHHGCHGVRLETVVLGQTQLTTEEAVQRWVGAQTAAAGSAAQLRPSNPSPVEAVAPSLEHQRSTHLLIEHRVAPTSLDRLINTLNFPRTTRAFAAGLLFRAALRTPEDARQLGREGLLAIARVGAKSKAVIEALWTALNK